MSEEETTLENVKLNYPTEEDKFAMMLILLDKIDRNTAKLKSINTILVILFILVLIGIFVQSCSSILN